ncbi:MAG TPA: DUF5362 family protein [Bacteroidales bacterium]|nr:DUF5362 family protein [Bacteroidales bacterium]HQQ13755.1 DUF5362 family protein [Bacteroidales bacterium]
MENLEQQIEEQNEMTFNQQMKSYLLTTAKWGKFLAIVGFIIIALIAVASVGLIIGFEFLREFGAAAVPLSLLGVVYLFVAAIYFIPTYYLFQFSEQIRLGLQNGDAEVTQSAFKNLKSLFKFTGILTLIFVIFYALLMIVFLPLSMLMGQ